MKIDNKIHFSDGCPWDKNKIRTNDYKKVTCKACLQRLNSAYKLIKRCKLTYKDLGIFFENGVIK